MQDWMWSLDTDCEKLGKRHYLYGFFLLCKTEVILHEIYDCDEYLLCTVVDVCAIVHDDVYMK